MCFFTHLSKRNLDLRLFSKGPEYTGRRRDTASIVLLNVLAFNEKRGRSPKAPLVDAFEVDLGATMIVPSLRAGINPAQFLDFPLGWTTLDIAGDDEPGQSPPPPTPQFPQKDATP